MPHNTSTVVTKVETLQDSFEDFKEVIVKAIMNISLQGTVR